MGRTLNQNYTITVGAATAGDDQPDQRRRRTPAWRRGDVHGGGLWNSDAHGEVAGEQRPGFTDLSNGGVYSGVTTPTLTVTGATLAMNGYQYRAVFTNGTAPDATTTAAT